MSMAKKLFFSALIIFPLLVALYTLDVLFHIGYTLIILSLITSPFVVTSIFFIICIPYSLKLYKKTKALSHELGMKTDWAYTLDSFISSFLLVLASLGILSALLLYISGDFILYILFAPQYLTFALIPSYGVVLMAQISKYKNRACQLK